MATAPTARDFRRRPHQVVDQHVDRGDLLGPAADGAGHGHALFELAFFSNGARHARGFASAAAADGRDLIERIRKLAIESCQVSGQSHLKIAVTQQQHRRQEVVRKRSGSPTALASDRPSSGTGSRADGKGGEIHSSLLPRKRLPTVGW